MKRLLLISAFATLGACNSSQSDYESEMAPKLEVAMIEQADTLHSAAQQKTSPAQTEPDNPASFSYMAYRYNYGFSLPAKNVASTAKSHADICLNAGPDKCQVLSSNTHSNGADYVTARLQIRGEPSWLETFKADMQSSIKDAKGELVNSSVNAEDLTRQILDTDARLKAKKTLRSRLEQHLETRDAKLNDLLAIERELARVQGEIESATTTLAVLKKRVSMSVIDVNYQSKAVAVSRSSISPIKRALKDFIGDISHGLASVIRFFAAILPWMIFVIIPLLWLLRWFWRRRKASPKARKPKAST